VEAKATSRPIHATLPWPPSVNHYWKSSGKRRYISPQARQWLEEALWLLTKARDTRPTIQGEVAVSITVYPPDRRKRDLDNLLKPILDALAKSGVIEDDYQVAGLHIERFCPEKPGRVEVLIDETECVGADILPVLKNGGSYTELSRLESV
jgi:crossover junction endodeoxyribonuclease RusA